MKFNPGLLLLLVLAAGQITPGQQAAGQADNTRPTATIDVVALDSKNRPVTALTPDDFRVTVDGEARPVVGLQYVVKGRGASAAARALAATTPSVTADTSRLVVLAVDEESVRPGAEKLVSAAINRVVDGLASADRVVLVSLPVIPRSLTASLDRGAVRDALARIAGRGESGDLALDKPEVPQAAPPATPPDDEAARNRANVEQPHVDRRVEATERTAEQLQEGPASPRALAGLLEGLKDLPGAKALIVFSGGERRGGDAFGSDRARAGFTAAADAAIAARAVVHAVYVPRVWSPMRDRELERLAALTGGRSLSVAGGARDLDALEAVMAGAYVLQIERRPDDDRRLRTLRLTTTRKDTTLLASARWAPRDDPPLPPLPAEPPPPPAATAPGAVSAASLGVLATRGRPRPLPRNDPELNAVLARASEYLDTYVREFSNVVAEEAYTQSIGLDRPNTRIQLRRLRSDLLLVLTKTQIGWVPFRDVFEVDGDPVRDREDRLQKLFLTPGIDPMQQAYEISQESARFNLGTIYRTVNVPTLALEFLLPGAIKGSNFVRRGEETVQGVRVWRIDFEEWASPTVIKTGSEMKEDYPVEGSFWIEPLTGRIVKTRVRGSDRSVSMESTVVFERNDAMGIWTPAEMKEYYERREGRIGGEAKYLNFRRFQVTTSEAIKVK